MTEASTTFIRVNDLVAGKYRVERVIGEGGMGIVVAATHEHLEQKVALKFLLPSAALRTDILQRFVREARAAVKIQSEHVARVFDVGTHEGIPFMVMEYLEGEDIAQVLSARAPLSVAEAVDYVLQASEAVAEAHALGIVHRDLKPANLFLAKRPTGRPVVKVLDFGISKVPASGKEHLITLGAAIMGTPSYMSPEQMVAAAGVDTRTDIWALGTILYEALTGQLPFRRDTLPELVAAVIQTPHEPILAVRSDLPAGLAAVVERCSQKKPEDRYPNVAHLARALLPFGPARSELSVERIEHLLRVAAPEAKPASGTAGAQSHAEGPTFYPTIAPSASPRTRRWLVTGVLAVCGVAAVLVFTQHRRSPAVGPTASSPADARSISGPEPSSLGVAVSASSLAPTPPSTGPTTPPTTTISPEASAAKPPRRPRPAASSAASASGQPSASAPAPQPTCRTVTSYDDQGVVHFKQECTP